MGEGALEDHLLEEGSISIHGNRWGPGADCVVAGGPSISETYPKAGSSVPLVRLRVRLTNLGWDSTKKPSPCDTHHSFCSLILATHTCPFFFFRIKCFLSSTVVPRAIIIHSSRASASEPGTLLHFTRALLHTGGWMLMMYMLSERRLIVVSSEAGTLHTGRQRERSDSIAAAPPPPPYHVSQLVLRGDQLG